MSGFTLVNLTVKNGKFEDRELIKNEMERLKEGTYDFVLKPSSNKLSQRQLNWWNVLAKAYIKHSKELGNLLTHEEAKIEMKEVYGLYTKSKKGNLILRSIKDLSKQEFAELFDLINYKWIEFFSVPAPEPWIGWRKDFEQQ